VVIITQIEKSALPVKSHMPDYINKEASASFGHTHLFIRAQVRSCSWRRKKRERGAFLGEDFLYLFDLSLGIVLSIYMKEVFAGFSPSRGFPRIHDVSLMIVYFSGILSMLLICNEMK
jgi:hypothetical protein